MGALHGGFDVEWRSSVGHGLSAPVRSDASSPRELDVALLGRTCLSWYSEATREQMISVNDNLSIELLTCLLLFLSITDSLVTLKLLLRSSG